MSKQSPPAKDAPESWAELIKNGDGHLTPEQVKCFEKAMTMIVDQMEISLNSPDDYMNIDRYTIGNLFDLEDKLLRDSNSSEIEQDAAISAYEILEFTLNEISKEIN